MYFKKSFVNISVINRLDYVIWDATLADCKSVETVISNLILINLDRVPLWRRLLSDYNLLSILVGLNIFQWRSAMFSVKRSGFAHGSTKRNKVRWISDPIWSERARELKKKVCRVVKWEFCKNSCTFFFGFVPHTRERESWCYIIDGESKFFLN